MKKAVLMIAVLWMTLTMAACAREQEISVDGVSARLLSEITYTDELSEIDLDTASMLFYFSDAQITSAKIYESGGATAEEIAVFECASQDDADKVMKAVQERVAEQKESFRDYVPEELLKLDQAVIVQNGNYVMLSVSDNAETAKKIMSGK